jgi:hypothetical protein
MLHVRKSNVYIDIHVFLQINECSTVIRRLLVGATASKRVNLVDANKFYEIGLSAHVRILPIEDKYYLHFKE